MNRALCILILTIILFTGTNYCQFHQKSERLISICNGNYPDKEKIAAYGQLAELHYIYNLDKEGDSLLQKQLRIAEFTRDKELILSVLFGNAINHLANWRNKEAFERALVFLQKGVDYAKAIGDEEYITLAYSRLASLYLKKGEPQLAFNNANIGFTTSLNIENDSVKTVAAAELGNAYQAKGEALLAFQMYTRAMDIAEETGNTYLQSEIYHRFADLYMSLNNREESRTYLNKSLELNLLNNKIEGEIRDYIDLARYTDEKAYLEKALHLADSIRIDKYIIRAKGVMYGYYTYIIGNSDSTLAYINNNSDFKYYLQNSGQASYNIFISHAFKYAGKYDSALHYLKLAEPYFDSAFDISKRQAVYESMADCFINLKNYEQSVKYYTKALEFGEKGGDLNSELVYAKELSLLYEKKGDYFKANSFLKQSINLNDSLFKLANQKEIAMAQVNNEKRMHERDLEKQKEQKLKQRNLQYIAITLLIGSLFVLLLVVGMFPLNKLTVRLFSFFIFICLFEFIVLLIDSWLHHIAHGEPLKIWMMKIFIIALLVPFQHYLEHQMVKFIESARLHRLRIKWLNKRKKRRTLKPADEQFEEIEKDTAVL